MKKRALVPVFSLIFFCGFGHKADASDLGCQYSELRSLLNQLIPPTSIEGNSFRQMMWLDETFGRALNALGQRQWDTSVVRRVFREKVLTREMLSYVKSGMGDSRRGNAWLDGLLDGVLGLYRRAVPKHVESVNHYQKNHPYDQKVLEEKWNEVRREWDYLQIRGGQKYEDTTSSYQTVMLVMDILRMQNLEDSVYTGELFDTQGFENKTFIDLGAGYPRMGLFLGLSYPGMQYIGYEIEPIRAEFGRQMVKDYDLSNVRYITQDLSDSAFRPMVADYYYMFDPFGSRTRKKVFADLKHIALSTPKPIRIIAICGFTNDIVEELSRETELPERDQWLTVFAGFRDPFGYPVIIFETIVSR